VSYPVLREYLGFHSTIINCWAIVLRELSRSLLFWPPVRRLLEFHQRPKDAYTITQSIAWRMNNVLRTGSLRPYYARRFHSSFSLFHPLRPHISKPKHKLQKLSFLSRPRHICYQHSRNFGYSHAPSHLKPASRGFNTTATTSTTSSPTTTTRTTRTTTNNTTEKYTHKMTVDHPLSKHSGVVKIVEVGARDGLQNEKGVVPTSTKIELLEKLSSAGLTHIEAGSFVRYFIPFLPPFSGGPRLTRKSPKWVPQMADTPEIMKHLRSDPPTAPTGVTYSYLTPNMKGLTDFIAHSTSNTGVSVLEHASEIAIFGSASEGFSQKNINCSIAESLERFRPVVQKALDNGVRVRGYVSMIIACPYDGPTSPMKVAEVVEGLLGLGCYEVSLGDTNGVGTPGTIGTLVNYLIKDRGIPAEKLAAHFHDTYGQAIVNCLVALEAGIRTFDSSVAGLGGCPYSKGATGNVATEDLVYLFVSLSVPSFVFNYANTNVSNSLEGTGVRTNVDMEKIVEIGDWISKKLGRKNESKVGTALMARRRNDGSKL